MAFKFRGSGKFGVSPKESRTHAGIVFDSKLEKNVWCELIKHVPKEEINRQVRFELQPTFYLDSEKNARVRISYRPDFVLGYVDEETGQMYGKAMVLDAKGMMTQHGAVAIKLFEYKYGLPVRLVKSVKKLREEIETYKNMKKVNDELVKAAVQGTPVTIKGYRSSDGSEADLVVQVVGREGYMDLLAKSLEVLTKLERPADVSKEAFEEGRKTVEDRLRNRMNPENGRPAKTEEGLTPVVSNLLMQGNDPDSLILLRLKVLERTYVTRVDKKVSSNPKVRITQVIEAMLPISRFLYRLDLKPGKYDSYTCG